MDRERVLELIAAERDRQDAKWGEQRGLNPFNWVAILGEEFGEVCEAVMDWQNDPSIPTTSNLLGEMIQVAAVIFAWLEQDQPTYRGLGAGSL